MSNGKLLASLTPSGNESVKGTQFGSEIVDPIERSVHVVVGIPPFDAVVFVWGGVLSFV